MIPEIGQFALILALVLALVQVVVPSLGLINHNDNYLNLSRRAAYAQFLLISISFAALAASFLMNDFSVAYVAQNSNSKLPKIYQFCAVWGSHEGSLLLWVTLLGGWMAAVARFSRELPLDFVARVLVVLALVAIGFYLLILMTSNPFERLLPVGPADGRDLNSLLQDPGLVSHPPMLYLGYVGFSVAFAFAIAALWRGGLDANWAAWTRPWTLLAWSFLTLGITLGSAWAYRVLGWGGFWFWDPVENASLMPWLAGTALIHSLMVASKRNTFKAWTVLLAICAFSLSLIGTFLVRSGVLVSVHAFAVDSSRGGFILLFLAIVIGGSLLLYAWRGQSIRNKGTFTLWSRETLLLSNNVLLASILMTVLLGTLYPLVIDALGLGKLSVGPPYFNTVLWPMLMPLLFLMGIGPLFHWRAQGLGLVWQRLRWTLLLALIMAIIIPKLLTGQWMLQVVIGVALAFWVLLATVQSTWLRRRAGQQWRPTITLKQLGMSLAHMGVAITLAGIILTTALGEQREVRMQADESATLGQYHFEFKGVHSFAGPNFEGTQARVEVSKAGKMVATLFPEIRFYPVQNNAQPRSAIHATVWRDLYAVLGAPLDKDSWSLRFYVKPFIRWIWGGGVIMMCGGLIAALGRRRPMVAEETLA
jgi:cytochrome c-type biogenesis protein CcmF